MFSAVSSAPPDLHYPFERPVPEKGAGRSPSVPVARHRRQLQQTFADDGQRPENRGGGLRLLDEGAVRARDRVAAHRVGDRAAREHAGDEHRSAGANEAQPVLDVLDDAGGIAPTVVIWTASAPAWAHIDPTLQAFPGQPG